MSKRVCALTPQLVWFARWLGDSHNPPQLVLFELHIPPGLVWMRKPANVGRLVAGRPLGRPLLGLMGGEHRPFIVRWRLPPIRASQPCESHVTYPARPSPVARWRLPPIRASQPCESHVTCPHALPSFLTGACLPSNPSYEELSWECPFPYVVACQADTTFSSDNR